MGGAGQLGAGVQFVLGFTAKSGFVFGDVGPFYPELYSMGGVQYGIPLRGYEEFSITPNGFDPSAGGSSAASTGSFGMSYAAFTVEAGARVSQTLFISRFFRCGKVVPSGGAGGSAPAVRGGGVGGAGVSPPGATRG